MERIQTNQQFQEKFESIWIRSIDFIVKGDDSNVSTSQCETQLDR